jgi:hypothetical protein
MTAVRFYGKMKYILYPWFMPLMYKDLRCIPVVRWCVLGI